ncbi:hypothetical protein Clacol_005745 [Clathrus columnatus]|uniref:CBS domain-containing protein n=1 Tax=Clathrus columnatus TaxID=1419009 RepID=A0AAV5ACU3_9AGAM|nr:hypothetical protein Clacol_005745 [Clathrus columnatus]
MSNDEVLSQNGVNFGQGRNGSIPLQQRPWQDEIDELVTLSIPPAKHKDGDSIDWINEENRERIRQLEITSQHGLRRSSLLVWDITRIWLVLISWVTYATDVAYMGFSITKYRVAADFNLARSFLHRVLGFWLNHMHLIPEIKAIVGGYILDDFLGPWTLITKGLGLALSVASGQPVTTAQKRKLLAAAAAAGVSVAFGSPLGGVLFGLEELNTFTDELVVWRAFVTSVIAAVALQYVDPFGTSKLVTAIKETWKAFELFPWLILGVIGGVVGAFLIKLNVAIAVYRRNSIIAEWPLLEIIVATSVTAVFSYLIVFARLKISIYGSLTPSRSVQTSDLVANLFLECDPIKGDWHGLCNPDANAQNIFLLLLTAIMKFGLTAYTFGMKVDMTLDKTDLIDIIFDAKAVDPCRNFPTDDSHRGLRRLSHRNVSSQSVHRAYPTAWIFSTCPPDLGTRCISPGFYAVIGASALLGGVTRMTISLVVILFELTGALSHVLPIMLAVMVSKWVGDAFGKEGIYDAWITMRAYPWLSPIEHRDYGATAASVMTPKDNLVVINGVDVTIKELDPDLPFLDALVKTYKYFGFPIVDEDKLLGFVTYDKLRMALAPYVTQGDMELHCTFLPEDGRNIGVNMASLMERAPMEFRSELAQELLVSIFQRLNLRYALFSRKGKLTGLITKRDVVRLLMRHYKNTPTGVLTRDGKAVDHEWDSITTMSLYDKYSSNSRFLSPQKTSSQTLANRRSKTSLQNDGGGRTASLAHELAAALMPEPITSSQLLADEFGIEFDDGAEGVEEESSGLVDALPDVVANDDLDVDAPHWGANGDSLASLGPFIAQSPVITRTISQDPLAVLNQDLQTTDLFIEHLRRLDTDSSFSLPSPTTTITATITSIPSSGELLLERLASDFIRKVNDSIREREGHVRELREVEKEFRRIAGQTGGNDILAELDELETGDGFGGDDSREKETKVENGPGGRALHTVTELEEEHDTTADWELDPQRVLGDDDQLDYRDRYRQNSLSHTREHSSTFDSFSNNPTPSNAITQLSNMRSLTQSLVQSLTTVVENTQVTGAATAEAGRKIRALKNKLGGWRAESEGAERSMEKIEKWEAAGGINGILENGLFKTGTGFGHVKGRRLQQVMQEELSAFELVLAEAGRKTQAIMAAA